MAQGMWDPSERELHINVLELMTIVKVSTSWRPETKPNLQIYVAFTVVNSDLGLRRSVAGKQRSVTLRNIALTLTFSD